MGRDGVDRGRGARTTGDNRFEVDDRVGEGGAVEGLAGNLECGEEERRGHRWEENDIADCKCHRLCHTSSLSQ